MKIQFDLLLTGNKIIPFDYQNKLCGAFYNAISKVEGYEKYHDQKSIHSISQLFGTYRLQNGDFIVNPNGNGILTWIISSPVNELILNAAKNLFNTKIIANYLKIINFEVIELTITGEKMTFIAQTPIILKKDIDGERHYYVVENGEGKKSVKIEGKRKNFYVHHDNKKCSEMMIGCVKTSAEKIGFTPDSNLKIYFDESYKNKKVIPVIVKKDEKTGKNIKSIATTCPVVIEGNPETINFIYDLGIGHSTGMGFGTLR